MGGQWDWHVTNWLFSCRSKLFDLPGDIHKKTRDSRGVIQEVGEVALVLIGLKGEVAFVLIGLKCVHSKHHLPNTVQICSKESNMQCVLHQWSIWNHRNRIVFSNNSPNTSKILDDAIFFCWSWLRNQEKGFDYPFHQWSSHIREGFCN